MQQTNHDICGSHFYTTDIEREKIASNVMAVSSCLDRILEADRDPATSLPDSLMLVYGIDFWLGLKNSLTNSNHAKNKDPNKRHAATSKARQAAGLNQMGA